MLSIRGVRERLTPPCTGPALLSHSFLVVLCLLREAKEIGHVCTGDPKTLTPGPWTSPTDQVHGPPHGPVHGPPIRTTPTDPLKKFNRKKK